MTQQESLPVAAARAGAAEAWDALFARYQLPLFAFVFELLRDEQASLDVVQEAFIRATRHLAQLREDRRFGSWLFGIAYQGCAQHWRRQKSRREPQELEAAAGEGTVDSPRDWLIRREDEERFRSGLGSLSPEHRSVLVLHFLEEFTLDEIARITGTGVGTVKSRMHYAKRALRRWMEENP